MEAEIPTPPVSPSGTRRVVRSFFVLAGGRASASLVQFVSFGVLAAHLGPGSLGVYTFAVALTAVFRVVSELGFKPVATRDIAQHPEREPELVPNLLYLRLLVGGLAYLVLLALVLVAGYEDENREAALIAGLMLVPLGLEAFYSVLEVRLKLGWPAITETLKAGLTLAGTIVLSALDAEVLAFVWLWVSLNSLAFLVVALAALRQTTFRWRPRPGLWVPLARAAAPIALATLFISLYSRLDVAVLARLKPAEDVGQYGAAYRFFEVFGILPAVIIGVLGPVLARSYGDGQGTLERRYGRIMHLLSAVALPVAVAGAMVAWRVLPALPGFARYPGAGVALAVLAPAAALILIGTVVQGVLVATHLQRRLVLLAAVGLVFNIAANLVLIPTFSYVGAAVATTITEIAVVVASVREVRKRLGLRWPTARMARLGAATGILAVSLVPGFALNPFLQLALGGVAYLVALVALGGVTRHDLEGILPGRDPPTARAG